MTRASRVEGPASGGGRRAQLVLVAAAVIAVGLATIALAYIQLSPGPDVAAGPSEPIDDGDVSRALDRAVHDAATEVLRNHTWSERADATAALEGRLAPRLETLRTARLTVHEIEYNETAARAWADEDCPDGPNRQFGDCEARGGVVVQERAGRTHVLGVTFDLRTTNEGGLADVTVGVGPSADR